ncbi:MAG: hypothetical protein E7663_00015 [Ruminococcaceae bacterium]|nr:hypothetical protein [Oscillospiraceae bacterium]
MKNEREILTVAVTGGPCGGKSTALSRIREFGELAGFGVVVIPETATELIGAGISPQSLDSNEAYQRCQMKLQLEKERIYLEGAARLANAHRVLVVCDRGLLDNRAYMTEEEFERVLALLGIGREQALSRYDAVFHLVSAAKGAQAFYTLDNNGARTEGLSRAAELDDALLAAWSGHPYHRVIDNSTDFAGKMDRLLMHISAFLEWRLDVHDAED